MSDLFQPAANPRRKFLRVLLGAGAALALLKPLSALAAKQQSYRVKAGDTLSGIARNHGITLARLRAANRIKGDRILAGQQLVIPASSGTAANPLQPVIAANRALKINRNRWRYIVAHHSAIEQGNARIYGAAHKRRGMTGGLAYHFVIGNGIDSGDGEIEVGPRWREQMRGGHVRNSAVNDAGIGICIVGNLENHAPTAKQRESFIQLVNYLRANCVAQNCKFTVHKWVDRNHTVCPGKHFPYTEMKRLYG